MFKEKTLKIRKLFEEQPERIRQMETLFSGRTHVYIDYANVRPWSQKLGWHVEPRRLKQLLDSFDNLASAKIYLGTLVGDKESEFTITELKNCHYDVRTKPVKIMRRSIDASSVPAQSPALLEQFMRASLLRKLDLATIEFLNARLRALNAAGEFFIEDRKCNFDVEIGRDMLIDHERNHADTFILWSGDSDFAEPVRQLLVDGKNVVLFATARRISNELSLLSKEGLVIFDIQKIRNFICWNKEIKRKGDLPKEAPKL